MAGSTRFELAAGGPEGSAFPATYPNGQRRNYSGAHLDRSGSFNEGVENRMLSSGPGSSRGSTSLSVEMPPLSHFLPLEPITMCDQKFPRSGELRRVLGVSLGSSSEDHSFGASHSKPPPPTALEELKRFKASVLDTSNKARDRVKKLTESIGKLDKYRHMLLSRKRRTDSNERSGGASTLKLGSQIHQNPPDLVNQRLENRTKNVVLNKRVRTSIAESEGRSTAMPRQPMAMDKDRDFLRAGGGGSVQVEEKIRGLPANGEGWDKKMKRKRSVGAVVTRAMDGDRDLKRTMHQKLSNDPRSRSCDAHGFGSGPPNGIAIINKLDDTSQPTSSNARAITKNELENVSFANDRRDRATGLDKERVVAKGNNKHNIRDDSQVGSPSPVTKGKASRAPRTGSGVSTSSPNFSRTPGALDGWEQPPSLNKVQSGSGANNRKRPIPTGSSSPPMAQWVGQRPQKISRTRRANLVPPVSNHDEAQISSEGFPDPDNGARLMSSEANGPLIPKGVSNNTKQFKMKLENVPSPARLSESEESGAGENKLKEKGLDNDETEDRSVNTIQKVGPSLLPTKKNKLLSKEEIGDGVQRQGRSGRASSLSKACIPPMREKLENTATTKPLQSTRPGSDKNESKSGRPPYKRPSERKAFGRPGHALNSGSSDMTGESDDDHEELLAAANSAYSARYLACSSSFWKKIEPIFASISSEDSTYLKQQLNFAEELDESLCHMFGADCSVLGELVHKDVPLSQPLVYGEGQGVQLNGVRSTKAAWTVGSVGQLQDINTLSGKLGTERVFENVTPLYQRVLSALIGEDEIEEFDHSSDRKHASFQYPSDSSTCGTRIHVDVGPKYGDMIESEIELELDFRTQKHCLLDTFSCDASTTNGCRSSSIHNPSYNDDELWQGDDSLVHSGFGQNNLDGPQPLQTNMGSVSSFECQYEQLCLDEKILLELQSIGLYPETVPDLAEGGEGISKNIVTLRKGLFRQVGKKKEQLCKIDNVIQKGREVEGRDLEQVAVDKLVEMAYKKRMACRGSNASKGGVTKVSKLAALAFVKRTIARCQKFEDTGRSCFSEPAMRDLIFSTPLCINDAKFVDGVGAEAAANTCVEARNIQPESRASAVGATSTLVEQHGPFGDKLDWSSSDAFQALTHSSDQVFSKHESSSNRGKKKEVLLDEVAGSSASRTPSAFGNTVSGGTKGRRSERDRDQNKYMLTRNSVAKAGRPALGSFRGERKTKTKPKQRTAQLSTSGNGLLGRVTETAHPVYSSVPGSNEKVTNSSSKVSKEVGLPSPGNIRQDSSKETEEPIDFTNLQLHEIDSIEELGVSNNLGGHHDLSSWLNFDEDGLQDHDSMGLEIPMDDLSELNMLI